MGSPSLIHDDPTPPKCEEVVAFDESATVAPREECSTHEGAKGIRGKIIYLSNIFSLFFSSIHQTANAELLVNRKFALKT